MAIDTKGAAWSEHSALYALPKALLGGTAAMRAAGQTYLSKGSAEPQGDYDYRLANTFLTDSYKRTLNYLTGQVFKKEPALDQAASAEIEAWSEDVDRKGNNLTVFAQKAFRAGLDAGVVFIYSDYSSVKTVETESGPMFEDADGTLKPRTLAAAKAMGWGPYWVEVRADQVIDAWFDVVDGKPTLIHFRYVESVEEEKDGWTRETVEQIRVLSRGSWAVWRKQKGADGKMEWMPHEQGTTTMPEIPLSAFIPGEPLSEYAAQPALMGLAELCLQHWQSSSGHRSMMDWLRRPIVFGKCLSHEDGFILPAAPGVGLHSSDPGADIKAVNVIPTDAVTSSAADLQALETKMGLYGLQLMMPRSGNVTASQIRRESAESDSALQRWAGAFQDTLENALRYTALWLGEQDGPAITVNTDFDDMLDDVEANVIMLAVDKGIISKQLAFETLKRRGLISTDQEWEEMKAQVENDQRTVQPVLGAQAAASALLGQRSAPGQVAT